MLTVLAFGPDLRVQALGLGVCTVVALFMRRSSSMIRGRTRTTPHGGFTQLTSFPPSANARMMRTVSSATAS